MRRDEEPEVRDLRSEELGNSKQGRGKRDDGGRPGEIRFARHLREFHWVKKTEGRWRRKKAESVAVGGLRREIHLLIS